MSFDHLAPFYRGMEFVLAGGKLQRCRLAWLDEVKDCRRVLIVGEGPGRFATECAKALPRAQITCVDASAAMLKRARFALQRAGLDSRRITFEQATLPEWQPPTGEFDLLVTHFFLDCFPPEQLRQVVSRLASAAQPGAKWLLADFCEPPRGIARWRAKMVLCLAYAFFNVATGLPARRLTAPDQYLEQSGLKLKSRKIYDGGLLHSDLWENHAINVGSKARHLPRRQENGRELKQDCGVIVEVGACGATSDSRQNWRHRRKLRCDRNKITGKFGPGGG